MTVFKDDLIDDFAAQNTSPPEKLFTGAVEFFEDHNPSATVALHNNLHTEIFPVFNANFIPNSTNFIEYHGFSDNSSGSPCRKDRGGLSGESLRRYIKKMNRMDIYA